MIINWAAIGGIATLIGGVGWVLARLRSPIVFTEEHISCAIPKGVSLPEPDRYEPRLHAHKLELSNWSLRHLEDVRLSVARARSLWGWEVDRASSIDHSDVQVTIEDNTLRIRIANMPRLEKVTISIMTYDWLFFHSNFRGSSKNYKVYHKMNVQGVIGLLFYGSLMTPMILHFLGII